MVSLFISYCVPYFAYWNISKVQYFSYNWLTDRRYWMQMEESNNKKRKRERGRNEENCKWAVLSMNAICIASVSWTLTCNMIWIITAWAYCETWARVWLYRPVELKPVWNGQSHLEFRYKQTVLYVCVCARAYFYSSIPDPHSVWQSPIVHLLKVSIPYDLWNVCMSDVLV
jgi:hypothetical protein